jgi:hypothetical protein
LLYWTASPAKARITVESVTLPPTFIQRRFEERFTAKRMAREYLVVYGSLIEFEALRSRGGGAGIVPLTAAMPYVLHVMNIKRTADGAAAGEDPTE